MFVFNHQLPKLCTDNQEYMIILPLLCFLLFSFAILPKLIILLCIKMVIKTKSHPRVTYLDKNNFYGWEMINVVYVSNLESVKSNKRF